MNEDEMDELLISGARDYNEPNAAPREEMWARIAEARRLARRPAGTEVRSTPWARIAAAAVIVLAVGIGIGRRLERAASDIPTTAATKTATKAPDSTSRTVGTSSDSVIPQLRGETSKTDNRVRELASVSPKNNDRAEDATPDLAYRLVMLRHIAGSEAMITAFRSSARSGEMDAQLADWSRDLLSTTRLLEASPVANDPTMRRLLEDLDLVIAQIARYAARGAVNAEELDLIEESINKRGVVTKLRSSLPARLTPAGT